MYVSNELLIKPFDAPKEIPLGDRLRTNGKILIPFVVSRELAERSNHERNPLNQRFHKSSIAAWLLAAIFLASPALSAEKKTDPGREQVRRLQQAQRKLEQEKAAVVTELEAEKKKPGDETLRASALKREVGALRSARDAAVAKLATSEAKLAETSGELQQAQNQLLQAENERKRLQNSLAEEKQQLAVCVDRAKELRKVSATVLELYEKKSCLDSTLQHEPFTGLKRVEIENAVEDLREKLDDPRSGS